MKQFKVFFLLVTFSSIVFTQDCNLILNQSDCSANGQCQWTQSSYQCENKVDCSKNLNEDTCDPDETNCKWIEQDQSCTLKPNACQLTKDQTSCNYPNSCNFTQGKLPTCTPKPSFGCSDFSKSECSQKSYCIWNPNSCQTSGLCKGLDYTTCQKNPNFCSSTVTQCDQTSSAQRVCQLYKTSQACKDNDCIWSNITTPACSAPECTVVVDEKGQTSCSANPNLCKVTTSSCDDLQNKCNYDSQTDCTDKSSNFCKWTGPGCYDNQSVCDNKDDCPLAQCSYTSRVLPQCTNNDTNNNCKPQSSQQDCIALDYCNFNPSKSECDNIQNCQIYPDNFCQTYSTCSWNPVFKCIAVSNSNSNLLKVLFLIMTISLMI